VSKEKISRILLLWFYFFTVNKKRLIENVVWEYSVSQTIRYIAIFTASLIVPYYFRLLLKRVRGMRRAKINQIQSNVEGEHLILGRRFYLPAEIPLHAVSEMYEDVFGHPSWNGHCYEDLSCAISPDSIVIDIGASEGFFVQLALIRNAGKVIAFEPVPNMYVSLLKTFLSEIAEGTVVIENFAVGEGLGEEKLYIDRNYLGSTFCESNLNEKRGSIPCNIMSIDKYYGNHPDLWSCDFIKIDAEGWEEKILVGAQSTIRKYKPKLSIAIYHNPEQAKNCANILKDFGIPYQMHLRGLSFSSHNGRVVLTPQILKAVPS